MFLICNISVFDSSGSGIKGRVNDLNGFPENPAGSSNNCNKSPLTMRPAKIHSKHKTYNNSKKNYFLINNQAT